MLARLKRLRDYSKVLKDDNDFDFSSILALLDYKLSRMEKHFRSDQSLVLDKERVAKQIKYARFLIARYFDDCWQTEEYKELEANRKPYDKEDIAWILKIGEDEEFTTKFLEFNEKVYKRQQDALMRLFRHLNLYIQKWWD